MRIIEANVTPIAFADPPLLNAAGCHEPLALRAIVSVRTEDGVTGYGETGGQLAEVEALQRAARVVVGHSVASTWQIEQRIRAELAPATRAQRLLAARAFSAFEVACLDAQGQTLGVPVVDLLGGAVRPSVPFSAYLFYKWGRHVAADEDDRWGPALTPEQIVVQARQLIDADGFGSIKLKAGVRPPREEIEAIQALREAFPDHPLRIDPNCAWSVPTALAVAEQLDGVIEYLEDPVPGQRQMAEVAQSVDMPLATNMCVVAFEDLPLAVRIGSVGVVLADHHYWGGLRHTVGLGEICDTFGLATSMHSNSHLGISLAAMTHVAAATPGLAYACDTHYPWNRAEDVLEGGPLRFIDGALPVPEGTGLGVRVDLDQVARLHERYLASGRTVRDDATYMRRVEPAFEARDARW